MMIWVRQVDYTFLNEKLRTYVIQTVLSQNVKSQCLVRMRFKILLSCLLIATAMVAIPEAIVGSQSFTTITSVQTNTITSTETSSSTIPNNTGFTLPKPIPGSGYSCTFAALQILATSGKTLDFYVYIPPWELKAGTNWGQTGTFDLYLLSKQDYKTFSTVWNKKHPCNPQSASSSIQPLFQGRDQLYYKFIIVSSSDEYWLVAVNKNLYNTIDVYVDMDVISTYFKISIQTQTSTKLRTSEIQPTVPPIGSLTDASITQQNSLTTRNIDPAYAIITLIAIVLIIVLFTIYIQRKKKATDQGKHQQQQTAPRKTKDILRKQFCLNCGVELPTGSKFCNKCGTKQP